MHRMLTPQQVANELQIDVEQVLQHIRAGRLIASNVSCGQRRPRWRIARQDLDAFLAARRAKPPVRPQRRRKTPPGIIEFYWLRAAPLSGWWISKQTG